MSKNVPASRTRPPRAGGGRRDRSTRSLRRTAVQLGLDLARLRRREVALASAAVAEIAWSAAYSAGGVTVIASVSRSWVTPERTTSWRSDSPAVKRWRATTAGGAPDPTQERPQRADHVGRAPGPGQHVDTTARRAPRDRGARRGRSVSAMSAVAWSATTERNARPDDRRPAARVRPTPGRPARRSRRRPRTTRSASISPRSDGSTGATPAPGVGRGHVDEPGEQRRRAARRDGRRERRLPDRRQHRGHGRPTRRCRRGRRPEVVAPAVAGQVDRPGPEGVRAAVAQARQRPRLDPGVTTSGVRDRGLRHRSRRSRGSPSGPIAAGSLAGRAAGPRRRQAPALPAEHRLVDVDRAVLDAGGLGRCRALDEASRDVVEHLAVADDLDVDAPGVQRAPRPRVVPHLDAHAPGDVLGREQRRVGRP